MNVPSSWLYAAECPIQLGGWWLVAGAWVVEGQWREE
jgi:hypothetical protein